MSYNWGPHYIVPTEIIKTYSGSVLLREEYNEDLLRKQLDERGLSRSIARMSNFWFYRKKNSETWTKIGESNDILGNFRVRWDTTNLENGQYEIIGFMQAFVNSVKLDEVTLANGEFEKWYKPISVKKHFEKRVIGEQNIVEVTVEN
ncbi:hypothetical protein ACFLSK_02810 [Chloroflexota bacterium]